MNGTSNGFANDERILILAPTARDAHITQKFLNEAHLANEICPGIHDLCSQIEKGCGAVLVAEEALSPTTLKNFVAVLGGQPSWSEIPVTIITSGNETDRNRLRELPVLGARASVTLLERPFGPDTLLSILQAALHSRQRQYQVRDLFEERDAVRASIKDSFVTLDRDWRYTYLNEKAADLAGRPISELLGRSIWELFPNMAGTPLHAALHEAAADQTKRQFDYYDPRLERWLEVRVYPSPRGLSIFSTDVTERKQAEERLEEVVAQRTAKLQEIIGDLEAFSYSISHDMRAPLRSMQGFAYVLQQECADKIGPACQDYLRRINQAAERMDRLIQDVLIFSRVTRVELKLQPVSVEKLLNGILESYPNLQPPHLDVISDGPLPEVLANEAALTQCLSNLLGNAIKFVTPGQQPRVCIHAEHNDGKVRLWVSDNGIGISPADQEKIFGIFQRVSKSYEGTGIGLAIVKKAVERMGGSVGVESELKKGSHFWIDLQAVPAPAKLK